jgi:hypothetical protein
MRTAFAVDGLIFLRIMVALAIKQRDKGWIFYIVFMFLSTPLIMLLTRIAVGHW